MEDLLHTNINLSPVEQIKDLMRQAENIRLKSDLDTTYKGITYNIVTMIGAPLFIGITKKYAPHLTLNIVGGFTIFALGVFKMVNVVSEQKQLEKRLESELETKRSEITKTHYPKRI